MDATREENASASPEQAGFSGAPGSSLRVTRKIHHIRGNIAIPVKLWKMGGYKWMTHHPYDVDGMPVCSCFRVSEESTGMGVSEGFGMTEEQAEAAAIEYLQRMAPRLAAEIAKHDVINDDEMNTKPSNSGQESTK